MAPPFPLTILRLAVLVAWAMSVVEALVPRLAPGKTPPSATAWAAAATVYLAFGLALWWNTRRIQGPSPTRTSVVLLVVQVVLATLSSLDLLFIVAAEAPLVLSGRAVIRWILAQMTLTVAAGVYFSSSPGFIPLAGTSFLPHFLKIGLALLSHLAWQSLAFAAGFLAATQFRDALALGRSSRELARVNAELRATQQLLADSSRIAERLSISRELHDAVGHHLAALSLNLELAGLRAADGAVEPVQEARAVAKLLLADVRNMVSTLRADRPLDLRQALLTLVAGTAEPRIHLGMPPALIVENPAQAHAVFRCVQEAVTNAIRHAQAGNVWIDVTRDDQRVEIRVRDDGRGATAVSPGNGLRGMRERLEDLGGQLEVQSEPGGGFRLRAWMPVAGDPS